MNIGEAAKASGVSAKMVRHYEAVGLFPEPKRTDAGYRQYSDSEVHTLRFIRQARDLGFSIHEIGVLVGLWQDRGRPSRQVKALAQAHIDELERKAADLLAMKSALEYLVRRCHGDDRPDCPILESLADEEVRSGGAASDRRGPMNRVSSGKRRSIGPPVAKGAPRGRPAKTLLRSDQ